MTGRNLRRGRGLIALGAAAAMLASCGGGNTAASNVVEMRDMEVVDGTTNDDMTDLDAVRTNGVGIGNASNSAAPRTATPVAAPESDADAETVAVE